MMVRVENIEKSYGKTCALRNVSFTVDKGEVFGIIGADGAGKTTLFRIMTTLL
ncbi:MAG: ATP-binding cassette domain-containing protein, partial [Rikenellaceae bacterium]